MSLKFGAHAPSICAECLRCTPVQNVWLHAAPGKSPASDGGLRDFSQQEGVQRLPRQARPTPCVGAHNQVMAHTCKCPINEELRQRLLTGPWTFQL